MIDQGKTKDQIKAKPDEGKGRATVKNKHETSGTRLRRGLRKRWINAGTPSPLSVKIMG